VGQDGGRDDGHFLWDWHSQAAKWEHSENAKVRKLLDESLERLHGALPATDPTVLKANLGLGIPARRSRPASGAQRQPSSDHHQQAPTGA